MKHGFDVLIHLICIGFTIIFIVFIIAWLHALAKGPTGDLFTEISNLFSIPLKLSLLLMSLK